MARRPIFFLSALSLAFSIAWAESDADGYTRMARVSYVQGQVSFRTASDDDWAAASVNFPLQPGDRVYTGPDGRAEIELDDGSVFRLAENTDLEILSMTDDLIRLRILLGLSTLIASGAADFEISTPAAVFTSLRKGVYRFDVVENGNTDAIVQKGELEAANRRFSRRISTGELLHVTPGEDSKSTLLRYDRRDAWDEWNERRDANLSTYANSAHLPENVYMGVAELYRHGRWLNVESYGVAWVPYSVGLSWSPYSVGRWCYRPLWGWTWISYEPWGWLPYHYGRWYHSPRFGWCWLPGPAFSFNFWSPGLVIFYYGPGWLSWCPLGPGDYYSINNYYFNRRIYSYQLSWLRALHVRAPGDPFNRHVHGAFRTVAIDHFRERSLGDGHREARWRNVAQPWREGFLVRDRLTVTPTRRSFDPAPDRPAIRPRMENPLPGIVRATAMGYTAYQDRITRIANPRISAEPSIVLPARDDRGAPDGAYRSISGKGRTIQLPQREKDETNVPARDGSAAGSDSGTSRRIANLRRAVPLEVIGEVSRETDRPAPDKNPESFAPQGQHYAPAQSYGLQSPERRILSQTTPENRTHENRNQRIDSEKAPGAFSFGRRSRLETDRFQAPSTGHFGIAVPRQPELQRRSEPDNAGSRAFSVPSPSRGIALSPQSAGEWRSPDRSDAPRRSARENSSPRRAVPR